MTTTTPTKVTPVYYPKTSRHAPARWIGCLTCRGRDWCWCEVNAQVDLCGTCHGDQFVRLCAACEDGTVTVEIEPGIWEGEPCPRCHGQHNRPCPDC